MGTITLPNFRVSGTDRARVRLKDGGVYVEWSRMTEIKAWLYSVEQKTISGRFDVQVDPQDGTRLQCVYSAQKPQYPGVNKLILHCKYEGAEKAYDKPLWNFVRWTADQAGEEVTMEDPEVDVEIVAEDMSSSVLDEATAAALAAAAAAEKYAAEAKEVVDVHRGLQGKSAYEVAVDNGYEGTEEQWLASLKGGDGDPGAAAGFGEVLASVDNNTGAPSVAVVASGPDTAKVFSFSFTGIKGERGFDGGPGVKDVVVTVDDRTGTPSADVSLEDKVLTIEFTGLKGNQGNSGYSGGADELEVVNNLTDGGATKALSAEMGKRLESGKVNNESAGLADLGLFCVGDSVDVRVYDSNITLDTIIYDGKSLRTIFETNNVISITPGFEGGSFSPYTINAGTPAVQSDEKDSGDYALKVDGSTSQQIISPGTAKGKAFMASRVKITAWTAGYCGIQYGNDNDAHDGGVAGVTNGWVTVVGEKTNGTAYRVYIGSFASANLTGYIDTPVIVFKSIFENVPSKELFTALYNKYCSLKRNETVSGYRALPLKVVLPGTQPSASDCKAAFLSAMNAKAAYIGATTAVFMDASGLTYSGSAASASDMLQILIHAAGIRQIAEKWNKNAYSMAVKGENARTENIETSVVNELYDETKYPILGGKTGTITANGNVNYNLAWIAFVGGVECACVLLGDNTDNKRWNDAEAIVEYLEDVLAGESPTLSVNAPCVAACKLPANPIMYDNFPFTLLASKSPTTVRIPASLTKIMSLILAYDYITDENEQVKIIASDVIGGSGDNLAAGDVVTVRDLVYDMLLPSSNDAATALARHIGAKILANQ